MNINMTLIGQTITFAVFVWFCMKFIWPPIMNALRERQKKIADGLAAAEQGVRDKELAQTRAAEILKEAKVQAQEILANAERRGNTIVEEAKTDAKTEGQRIVDAARGEIEQEVNRAREALRGQVAGLIVNGAGQILEKEIDAKAHSKLLDDLVAQL
jgi:F-type H+-transporting ATPase subunit b